MFGLTPTQEGILFHYLEHPGSVQYVEQIVMGIDGDLDIQRLGRSWDIVLAAHPSLRTVFRWEHVTSPVQVVLKNWRLDLRFHDLSTLDETRIPHELENHLRVDRREGFDLTTVPLRVTVFRAAPRRYVMVLTHHHIISDGWSNSIMLQDLFTAYGDDGEAVTPPQPAPQFKEYVKWLRQNQTDRDKEFWSDYLRGVDTITAVHRQELVAPAIDSAPPEPFDIPESLGRAVDALTRLHHLTPAAMFSAVTGLLLQRYANRRDVLFGTALSGRSVPVNGIEKMVGLLIHTVPVRVSTTTGDTVAAVLDRIGGQLRQVEEHARLPLVDIKGCSQYQGPEDLFRVLMVVENYPVQGVLGQETAGISIQSVKANEAIGYDMTIVVRDLGAYELSILYDHTHYSPQFVRRMGHHFIRILSAMAESFEGIADHIDILTEDDRRSILYDLNGELYNQPLSSTMWEAALELAQRTPDAVAIEEPLENSLRSLTVNAFLHRANAWKRELKRLGVRQGHIVGFAARRTADLVCAIFGTLATGATYLPVDPNLPAMRMRFMLRDSNIKVLVGHDDIMEPLTDFPVKLQLDREPWETGSPDMDDCRDYATGDCLNVIYTSGSTGVPKGVMIRQWSVINLLSYLQHMVGFTANDCLLFKTTYSFDVSISEIFGWMWGGARLAVLPSGQEKEPLAILETIHRRRVTVANFVPSLFTAFCNFLESSNIDMLSTLRIIFLGGEPVLPETIHAFGKWGLDVPLYNAYGPTETTIYTTLYDLGQWNGNGRISVGLPVAGAELAILNIFNQVQPKGAPGELVISGTGVSAGYQNNIELTSQKYIATHTVEGLATLWKDYPALYRVGDLISLPENGSLEFLGRMDHQVKIRGFRIELGEIEDLLLKHPAIAETAVIVHQASGSDKSLVAFIIPEEPLDHNHIRDYLADHLPSYMVPSQFVELKDFPRTTSGKVDRKVLAPPEAAQEAAFTPPRNVLERQVADIWASVLEIEDQQMDVHKDFYDFGGHSIKAIALIARLYKQFSIRMTVADVFQNPTIALMAAALAKARQGASLQLSPLEARDYYPASSAQRRLMVLQQMEPGSTLYNMPVTLEIDGPLDIERLESIFQQLIRRHPALRTGFLMKDLQPAQRIFKDAPFQVEELGTEPSEEQIAGFIRPFDLEQPPLLRLGMGSRGPQRHLLILDMHHIISDGTSMNILMREFLKLYAAEALPELPYNYADYSQWQGDMEANGTIKKQERFWLDQFSGGVPVMELPIDHKRPLTLDQQGACLTIQWDSHKAAALKTLMEETGATGYMVFSALLNVLLAKLSGEEDIVTGGVIEGRRYQEFQPVVGMFVNTIALRHYPKGETSFSQLVGEVKEKILQASQHSDYPFERLVEKIWDNRDPGRHPLFDVMMTFDQEGLNPQTVNGLSITPVPIPRQTAKFDITYGAQLRDEAVELEIEYSTSIYNESTMLRFAGYLETILMTAAAKPAILLKDIELLDETERKRVLQLLDNTGETGFTEKTIQQRFSDTALHQPDRIACVSGMDTLSYKVLDDLARQTASALRSNGVTAGDIVALAMERSPEMIGAILGVLYAGACYLPIDPTFPAGRISYMLADSAADMCISNTGFQPPQGLETRLLAWDEISSSSPTADFEDGGSPSDPAYIIYTSGTTGKPKGVVIEQGNISRLLFCGGFQFDFSSHDIWTMFHSYCFDFSVWEMYGALLFGGKLIMVPSAVSRETAAFLSLLKRESVTVLNQTPSAFYALADVETPVLEKALALRYVIFGGEALRPAKLKEFHNQYPHTQLINMFGITETTVHVTFKRLTSEDIDRGDSFIGGPIPTLALHIADQYGNPAPQGVAGELMVGGAGVGRGYLNRPELTADKFGHDPFGRGFRIYKSGDKARLLDNGDILYMGRIDQQVQIRGFRVEMGEIQSSLLQHQAVKEAVVTDRQSPGGDAYLCAYVVWNGQPVTAATLKDLLEERLPHYMIPQFFIPIDHIPLTSNGKLDRKGLPDPLAHGDIQEHQPLTDPLQIEMAAIWSDLLGVSPESIGLHTDFFQLGGHSLKAAALVSKIQQQLDTKIPLADIFRNSTLLGIADSVKRRRVELNPVILPAEQREVYPLSSAQQRLFVLHRLDPEDTSYNVPVALELNGPLDVDRVCSAWRRLQETYEILRTAFYIIDGRPVQRILPPGDTPLTVMEGEPRHLDDMFASFIRPFDLEHPPLFRVAIEQVSKSHSFMLVDMHHIICDAITSSALIRQFNRFYNGEGIDTPQRQYKDYAVWQQQLLTEASLDAQQEYWLRQYETEAPVLELPFDKGDRSNPHTGELSVLRLPRPVVPKPYTLFMTMLAGLSVFLRKVCNQDDIVIGAPVAGRRQTELEAMPGVFINTLPVRVKVNDNDSLTTHMAAVRELAIQAFANQDYPFEELVDRVVKDRDTDKKPLFDVMLVAQDRDRPRLSLDGTDATVHYFSHRIPKFQLTVTIEEGDDDVALYLNYSPRRFSNETITRLMGYFQNALTALVESPDARVADVDILPSDEKERLLNNFSNDGHMDLSNTVAGLFEDVVRRYGQRPALTAPSNIDALDGGVNTLTYKQLDHYADRVAVGLRQRGVKPGDIVAISVEPSVEMMAGLLGIVKRGAAYLPIDPRNPQERTDYILKDSDSALLLTIDTLRSMLETEGQEPRETVDIAANDILYTIYTSGTTGRSKGVLLTHRNMVNYAGWFKEFAALEPEDQTILTSSFAFDLGYTSIYSALLSGCRLHLVPRETILAAESLLEYLHHHQITYIKVTPSLFSTLVESPAFQEGRLEHLRLAIIGGEAIKFQDLRKVVELYSNLQIVNHYGPTETTIGSIAIQYTTDDIVQPDSRSIIGRPIANTHILIADAGGNLLPVGVIGEICISGAGVGRGYVNCPQLTMDKFVPNPYVSGQTMYRTGDLGRYTQEWTIEFLGRMDHQVKIRGFRVELGEIENALLKLPEVTETVVVTDNTLSAEPLLCAYVVGEDVNPGSIRQNLESSLPDYMIPSFIIPLDKLPLTPNGKLDRKALPAPAWDGAGRDAVAPQSEGEHTLARIWSELLGIDTIGDIDANFFHLGGHSLKAIHLVSRIQAEFGVQIPLARVFDTPTIRGLAQIVQKTENSQQSHIEPAADRDYYPLSSAQKRMFILQQADPHSTAYNMPAMFKISGDLDSQLIEQRFGKLIQRHQSLRTTFMVEQGSPSQRISNQWRLDIQPYAAEFDAAAAQFIRPFDLSQAPLLRVGLAENRSGERALLVDMHHIIADGASRARLIQEFISMDIEIEFLEPAPLRYIDYCCWLDQRLAENSSELERQKDFWLDTFAGEIPVLDLPLDAPRPKTRGFNGGEHTLSIDKGELEDVEGLAQSMGMTVYMVMMAVVGVLLSKYCRQEDIVVGTVSEGRRQAELEPVIGMFVNTLALRLRPESGKTALDYLNEVKNSTLAMFENQDYPFEELLQAIDYQSEANRNPLFDVLFVLESYPPQPLEAGGIALEPLPLERNSAKFDLAMLGRETGHGIDLVLEYNSDILSPSSVVRMAACLQSIVMQMTRQPERPLSAVSIIGDSEKRIILQDFNDTKRDYPVDMTIHQLFSAIAAHTPDAPAVIYKDRILSYGELERRSGFAARQLRSRGVAEGMPVGIVGRRSIDTIIALLAILKAGGVYMPINPDYPPQRKRLLLENGAATLLIGGKEDAVPEWNGECLTLDATATINKNERLPEGNASLQGAYIMYTSGSSGTPKGVVVDHGNVTRLVKNTNYIDFADGMRILQTGALEFDASTFEIWGALLNGLALCLADKQEILTAAGLKATLLRHRVTTIWLTSSLFNQLSQTDLSIFQGLKHLLVGGEALSPAHINRFRRAHPRTTVINGYGPTENTTFSTYYTITGHHNDNIPIGSPIANSTAYIFNDNKQLQPVMVPGELWVGGDGVARGYLNDPELTAEKFTTHPLLPDQRLYRTGDLARWRENGAIEFLGRIDKQVKIRGFRVEPDEVRQTLLTLEKIDDAFVMAVKQQEGTMALYAYIAASHKIESAALRRSLESALPAYMIPSYFIQVESIPLTANGKVDTRSLPQPDFQTDQDIQPPATETEQTLAGLWASILGVDNSQIGRNQHFFESGGHSLRATRLAMDIHRHMQVDIPLAEIFARPLLSEMAQVIDAIGNGGEAPIERIPDREFYQTSIAQKRLFILHHMNPASSGYNIPIALLVNGELDRDRLQTALDRLVDRHEPLRTSFHLQNDEPMMTVHPSTVVQIQDISIEESLLETQRDQALDEAIQGFIQPFALDEAPLMRVGLAEIGESEYLLLVDLHHIIADGLSLGIIVTDFMALYRGRDLSPLNLRFRDYAQWQRGNYQTLIAPQVRYWLDLFAAGVPVLDLPADFQRPPHHDHQGQWLHMEIQPDVLAAMQTVCRQTGATMFMVLLSTLSILLSKLSGQESVVVGTPVSGRGHGDVKDMVGMFVNTLPLLLLYEGDESFDTFLARQKQMVLEAFANQHAPFEEVVEGLDLVRDTSRNPLFDVMLSYHSADEDYLDLLQTGDLPVTEYRPKNAATKFDLSVTVQQQDDRLLLTWQYYASLLAPETVEDFISYFRRILSQVSRNQTLKLKDIECLSAGRKNDILYHWNQTEAAGVNRTTVHQLFKQQAIAHDSAVAIRDGALHLAYGCLAQSADRASALLAANGIAPGAIVALMGEHSYLSVAWILGIVQAGCVFLPLDPATPDERIAFILNDSAASLLIGMDHHLKSIDLGVAILDMKDLETTGEKPAPESRDARPLDPCYIIYTSGSTGTPKGVIVEHGSIVNYLLWGAGQYLGDRTQSVFPLYTSLAFDLTVTSIFLPLVTGNTIALFKPSVSGNVIKDIVAGHHVDIVKATPTHLKMLTAASYDSNRTRVFVVGGEELETSLAEELRTQLGEDVTVYNEYGPTEATVGCMIFRYDGDTHLRSVPIGTPIQNARIYILDNYLKPVPPMVAGELYIGGHVLARGYLNRPQLTAERFTPNPFMPGERMYRSGDLARRLRDGNLEFLGRIDHQVKIRGHRVELDEITHHVKQLDGVSDAVVVAKDGSAGDLSLRAYVVLEGELDEQTAGAILSRRLPSYMIPSYFIAIERIPIAAGGKLDRRALPEPQIAGAGYVAPETETQRELAAIWAAVLSMEQETIGIHDNFFQLGGHSLKAVILAARIEERLRQALPISMIFSAPTLSAMAVFLEEQRDAGGKIAAIQPVEERDSYPLTFAQRRLFTFQHMTPEAVTYNTPVVAMVNGELDIHRFQTALDRLVRRHRSLRTSFHTDASGQPEQRVAEHVDCKLEVIDVADEDSLDVDGLLRRHQLIRPFRLENAPLLRTYILALTPTRHLLVMDMHHIVSDGVSFGAMLEEFFALYEGRQLPPVTLHYTDYAVWQQSDTGLREIKRQEDFWITQFEDSVPSLELPADFARPAVRDFAGERYKFRLEQEAAARLRELAQAEGTTLFMTLLTLYTIFLSKLSGQEDVTLGAPVAGRNRGGLERVQGMFVNTLVLRYLPKGQKNFKSYLHETATHTLAGFDHQDYPYEDLIRALDAPVDTSRNPLFDTVFALQDETAVNPLATDLSIVPQAFDSHAAKFDLTMIAVDEEDHIQFTLEYSSSLFKPDTIERFAGYWLHLLTDAPSRLDDSLYSLELIDAEERHRLISEFNRTQTGFPAHKTVPQLFMDIVNQGPDRTAIVFQDHMVTYSQFQQRAMRLAARLRKQGARPGEIVGLAADRGIDMMVGIMGILMGGCAYLPINTSSPPSRMNYMLADSNAPVCVGSAGYAGAIERHYTFIDLEDPASYVQDPEFMAPSGNGGDAAYVIYTSGTTGKPKGVLLSHKNVARLSRTSMYLDIRETDRMLQVSNFAFDGSVFDIFGAFLNGAALVLTTEQDLRELEKLGDKIRNQCISVFLITTALFNAMIDIDIQCFKDVKTVLFGAERVSLEHCRTLLKYLGPGRMLHMYGPSEATVYATYYPVQSIGERQFTVPIGGPIDNTCVYILDERMQVQPVGVSGEIYIGGHGLATGYLNRPDLTAEKFVPNPFHPGETLYRSGDLGRWLPEGIVEFQGRVDQQVKVRGFRIEPGEIEKELLMIDGVKESLVSAEAKQGGEHFLAAYIVADSEIEVEEIKRTLSDVLPHYMIPSRFFVLDRFPMTANNKIDRRKLPRATEDDNSGFVAPVDPNHRQMARLWESILGVEQVGVTDHFFDIGGHSIAATRLVNAVRREFRKGIKIVDLYRYPELGEFCSHVFSGDVTGYQEIPKLSKQQYYEVSFSQKRMWVLFKKNSYETAFNLSGVIEIPGTSNVEAVSDAMQTLVDRHEAFRTYFEEMDGEPVQKVVERSDLQMELLDISSLSSELRSARMDQIVKKSMARPINILKPPLYSCTLVKMDRERFNLLLIMHHIVSDGWSMEILRSQFLELLNGAAGQQPRQPAIQYKEYAAWQNRLLTSEQEAAGARQFWLEQLKGAVGPLDLPKTRLEGEGLEPQAAAYRFVLPRELLDQLNGVAKAGDSTLFMVMTAALNICLWQLTGQKEVSIAIPAAGREHQDLMKVVGFFVNTLILHHAVDPDVNFNEFLQTVQRNTQQVMAHQTFPLELIFGELNIRYPEISVFFNMLNIRDTATEELTDFSSYHKERSGDAKYDIVFYATPYKNGVEMVLAYQKNSFTPAAIEKIMTMYHKVLINSCQKPNNKIKEFRTSTRKRLSRKKL
jgi:tyrocidine synthetase-3